MKNFWLKVDEEFAGGESFLVRCIYYLIATLGFFLYLGILNQHTEFGFDFLSIIFFDIPNKFIQIVRNSIITISFVAGLIYFPVLVWSLIKTIFLYRK